MQRNWSPSNWSENVLGFFDSEVSADAAGLERAASAGAATIRDSSNNRTGRVGGFSTDSSRRGARDARRDGDDR